MKKKKFFEKIAKMKEKKEKVGKVKISFANLETLTVTELRRLTCALKDDRGIQPACQLAISLWLHTESPKSALAMQLYS